MLLTFLLKHNLIPYIAIIILGSIVYWQHGVSIKQKILISEQEAGLVKAHEIMGIIQVGNELRLKELEKVGKSIWKVGKHEEVF